MITTPFLVGEKEYLLRYTNKQIQDIRSNAPKKFMPDSKIKKFMSPLQILDYAADMDVQIYLIEKGLEHDRSGFEKIDTDKAADLRQEYLEQGEADSGEKQEALIMLLADALALNAVGASGKKLMEKGKEAQEKAKLEREQTDVEEYAKINESRILAQARAAKKLEAEGIRPGMSGTERPPESA